jgi:peptidyl-prolyl cis-trans isomerase D
MISAFRRYLETWVVRGFFLIMVFAFITWGVGDVVRLVGTDTWVAKIGSQTIEMPEAQQAFQRQMAQLTARLPQGTEPTADMRRAVADAALQSLINDAVLGQEERRLGIVAPDEAVRRMVFSMPAFRGPSGQFDHATLEAVLRNNGLTEATFLNLVRTNLAQQQLLGSVAAGAAPPQELVKQVFAFQFEQRSADVAELPFAAAPAPAAPDEAVLMRWYENHPDSYSTPEYRRIKAVVLSPETVAKDIPITDADVRAAYEARKASYVKPERRSVQVVQVPDQAKADALATQWRGGADWAAMQTAAQADSGSGIELDDTDQAGVPDTALAHEVFAAAPDTVSAPIKGLAGWQVIKVIKVTPGVSQSFDQVKDALRTQLLADKAVDLIYDRANKVDNILGSGAGLDELPSDLGLVGVLGTMDAEGDTLDGKPAPIPGGDAVRQALIAAAFQAHKGDPPRLTEVPLKGSSGSAYYALTVEDVIPPAPKPYDLVKDQVLADWTHDAVRHAQETAAAKLLTAVQHGQTLADAAAIAGVPVRRTPLSGREQAVSGMPSELLRTLFSLKPGEPTMVETPDGFIVAVPAEIQDPDPAKDPTDYQQMREALARAMGNDVADIFSQALRDRAQPRINQKNLDSISGP